MEAPARPVDKTAAPHWRPEERERPCRALETDLIALLREIGRLKVELHDAGEQAYKQRKALLLGLLNVLDAFDRFFANIRAKEKDADKLAKIWAGNFRAVRREFWRVLEEQGITPIEAPEGKALPGFHEIIEVREQLDLESDTILEEIERGYLWRSEVLRKSKVITVRN